MKKFLYLFCFLLVSIFMLSSCGNPCKEGHTFEQISFDTTTHWKICSICGITEEPSVHNYTEWKSDKNGHYQSCDICQYETDAIAHNYAEFVSELDQHYQICSVCNAKSKSEPHIYIDWILSDIGHYQVCTICQTPTDISSHDYAEWSINDNGHYQICSICQMNTETQAHTYHDYQFDNNGHQQVCSTCQHVIEQVSHTFDAWQISANTHARICTTCSFIEQATAHNYSTYTSDNSQHWLECICGEKAKIAAHTYADYQFDSNSHWKICTACNHINEQKGHSYIKGTQSCSVCPFDKITDFNYPTGTITTKYTEIETEHFIFKIDANIYVVNDLKECAEKVYDILEKVSGLSFSNPIYGKGKIIVNVNRTTDINAGESEGGSASASQRECMIRLRPYDLFIGNSYAFLHELSHRLQFAQSPWYYGKALEEGFAEYTTYKALLFIHDSDPEFEYRLQTADSVLWNTLLPNQTLYSQNVDYWLKNGFPYGHNENYNLGFRIMYYLENVYGNYTKWIMYYENGHPFHSDLNQADLPHDIIIQALTTNYDNNVLNNFYSWLNKNETLFIDEIQEYRDMKYCWNMTNISKINLYPLFGYGTYSVISVNDFSYGFQYNNLYINLGETKKYLSEYKHKNTNNLQIVMSSVASINLYDKNGNLIKTCNDKTIALTPNVCYIRLNGEGYLRSFEITGY